MPPLNPFEKKRLALALGQLLAIAPATQAADLTVTSAADDDGTGCTLREAIVSINAGSDQSNGCGGSGFGGNDSIGFASSLSGQTITLTGGALSITGNVALNGPGHSKLSISGNNSSGVFHANSATVTFSGLTITGGDAAEGAGIYGYDSNITLNRSTVSGNTATVGGGGVYAIAAYQPAALVLSNSIVSGNTATLDGGGIHAAYHPYGNEYLQLSLSNSTVSGNTALRDGGGIYAAGYTTANLENSTVSGNSAAEYGGGVFVGYNYSSVVLLNSTLSGNSATGSAGGVFVGYYSTAELESSTLSGNSAASRGGVLVDYDSTLSLTNTILANSNDTDCYSDGTVTNSGGNLVESNTNCGTFDVEGQDPKLEPLKNNGGATMTQALGTASPAINAGLNGAGCPGTDQRDAPRTDGMCDIGAYEFGASPPGTLCGVPMGTNDVMLRDVVAEWLGKCSHDASHTPPAYSGVYGDVSNGDYYADWIQQIYNDGTTNGCNATNTTYCPKDPVAKTSAVKLILRAKYPWDYPPTMATMAPFLDIPLGHPDIDWIAKAKEDGVTTGCGDGSYFCADEVLTEEAFHKMLDAVF